MKNQTLILMIVAGACGLVAMLGVKQYLDKQNEKEARPTVTVLTASTPIKGGEALTTLNTEFTTVDAEQCPPGVVTDIEQIAERGSRVPRGVGDWIFVEQLTEKGQIGAVSNIPAGYRVSTISVDATTHHSGMLQPGNRIDLMLLFDEKDKETGDKVSRVIPLLEYVEVFAVDNAQFGVDQSAENENARNISLLVTIDQMQRLLLAKKKGTISTVLRSSDDKEEIDYSGMDDSALTERTSDSRIHETSSLDTMEPDGFAMPGMDMMTNLKAEVGGTGPVRSNASAVPDNMWVMAIHEGGQVRVEHVNEDSDVPLDTRGSSAPTIPGNTSVPGRAGASAGGAAAPEMPGLGVGLDEIAEGLAESFGI